MHMYVRGRVINLYALVIFLQRRPCPEEDASFLSRITWWWQNGQIWSGWRHPIKYEDLARLNAVDQSRVVAPRFQSNWDRELKKARWAIARVLLLTNTV